MRTSIDRAIDQLEAILLLEEDQRAGEPMSNLIESLGPIQEAYINIILQALRLLMQEEEQTCRDLMQTQRQELQVALERIAVSINTISEENSPLLKSVVEFLYTRSRLVDEIKMFPKFSLELLERMSVDQSLDEVIHHLEYVMTGRKGLYQQIQQEYETLNQK